MNVDGVLTEFLVVHQGNPDTTLYDSSCDGTWLLMKDVYTKSAINSASNNYNNYENSTVHNYLNNTFIGLLDSDIQSAIKQVKIPYTYGYHSYSYIKSGSDGLPAKVFLLSAYELGWTTSNDSRIPIDGACLEYFENLPATDTMRISYYNGTVSYWWLRSEYTYDGWLLWLVAQDGSCTYANSTTTFGVRPAFILPSEILVDGDFNVIIENTDEPEIPEEPDEPNTPEEAQACSGCGMTMQICPTCGKQNCFTSWCWDGYIGDEYYHLNPYCSEECKNATSGGDSGDSTGKTTTVNIAGYILTSTSPNPVLYFDEGSGYFELDGVGYSPTYTYYGQAIPLLGAPDVNSELTAGGTYYYTYYFDDGSPQFAVMINHNGNITWEMACAGEFWIEWTSGSSVQIGGGRNEYYCNTSFVGLSTEDDHNVTGEKDIPCGTNKEIGMGYYWGTNERPYAFYLYDNDDI